MRAAVAIVAPDFAIESTAAVEFLAGGPFHLGLNCFVSVSGSF